MSEPDCRRPEGDAELGALKKILATCFHSKLADPDPWFERVDPENIRVVEDAGSVAGGLFLVPMGQWFGGRSVPTTGIAAVGTSPPTRARGAATRLMQGTIRELHANGVALSTLFPSTRTLYRRAGYECAGTFWRVELPTRGIRPQETGLDVVEAGPDDHAAIEEVVTKRARATHGNLDRGPYIWDRVRDERREPLTFLVRNGDAVEGYVSYVNWKPGGGATDRFCRDLVAVTPAAARRLLAFMAQHRTLVETFRWDGHVESPVLHACIDRIPKLELLDYFMLRLVHVPAAFEARGYPADLETELHLDVTDDVVPENAGRHLVRITDGRASVETGAGRGSIAVDVRGLAALYSGHLTPVQLRNAVPFEAAPEDERALAAAFAGPAPWLDQHF